MTRPRFIFPPIIKDELLQAAYVGSAFANKALPATLPTCFYAGVFPLRCRRFEGTQTQAHEDSIQIDVH